MRAGGVCVVLLVDADTDGGGTGFATEAVLESALSAVGVVKGTGTYALLGDELVEFDPKFRCPCCH